MTEKDSIGPSCFAMGETRGCGVIFVKHMRGHGVSDTPVSMVTNSQFLPKSGILSVARETMYVDARSLLKPRATKF